MRAIDMRKTLVSIAISFLMILSMFSSVHGGSTPSAEIAQVNYPTQVSAGQSFEVNVSIKYSYDGWTKADLGIFQGDFTEISDYVLYYLTGDGVRSFTLMVTAPTTSTDLQLKVATRYWYQDFWLNNDGGSEDFVVKVLDSSESHAVDYRPSTVKIGESEWYYWNNSASNTCLIWLSGGHGYADHVTMNPYEMETFGAMKYINDLSQHYSVLALYKGTEGHTIPIIDQTFYALGYYPNSVFVRELYDWSREEGYDFTYLIGYSTGGMAAGYEAAVRDPETWAAPNGVVIISAPLSGLPPTNLLESVTSASNLKANIELLYGQVWSEELWPQGKQFFDNAPEKTGTPWYLKEWHLFPDSSHEVWVKEQDGAHYNNVACSLTVQFIEKSISPLSKLSEWNDGSIDVYDVTVNNATGEQKPKTTSVDFATKVGHTMKVKIWLYNCSNIDTCRRANVSYIKVDLYSSEGYIDTRYTNIDGYEEFVFTVPDNWMNKTVKLFVTLSGEYRGIYTPTVNLWVES
jgi:pimeloyl-ACP methyl ester carboxylesterase